MAKPRKFAHIVYRTRRFEEMIAWYQDVFEAKVQYQNPMLAFLTYDDEHHRFAFVNLSAIDPDGADADVRSGSGVDHVAYTYADLADLLGNYKRLKSAGIEPYWPVHHGVTISLYYRDPDGNRMEFQVDCFASAEEGSAYMRSDAFSSNPIGVLFEPTVLTERYDSGTPLEELLRRPEGPQAPVPPEHGTGA